MRGRIDRKADLIIEPQQLVRRYFPDHGSLASR
jgi:hypothetical protein